MSVYYVGMIRDMCADTVSSGIKCDSSKCAGRNLAFLLLAIASIGCLVAFTMHTAGALQLSRGVVFVVGVGSGFIVMMLAHDFLKWIKCIA